MDRSDNVVVLTEFRVNKARLLKEQGNVVVHPFRASVRSDCTMHTLATPNVPEPGTED